uniref:N-acetyltransferase domain-containing protein n=1 Tax=Amphimedon queenslandica TaxID=400682 RepID=A0A1X7U385_AMPQE
ILRNGNIRSIIMRNIRSLKLHSVLTRDLDQKTRTELYDIWQQNITGKNSYEDFTALLGTFDRTYIVRDYSNAGKICATGSYAVLPTDLRINSRQIHIIPTGVAYILPEYQRRGLIHKFFLHMTLRENLLHPFTPLYITINFLTYKYYPAFLRFSEHAYPRYDRPTPDMEKKIMEYYVLHYLNCSDTYDPERGVVQLPQTVKGEALLGVANVSWK